MAARARRHIRLPPYLPRVKKRTELLESVLKVVYYRKRADLKQRARQPVLPHAVEQNVLVPPLRLNPFAANIWLNAA